MALAFHRTLRALEADGAARAWVGWGWAGLLFAAWCAWFFAGRVTLFEASRTARVEVWAAARPVAAPQAGVLLRAGHRLGDVVKAGDVLFELDDRAAALAWREEAQRLAVMPAARDALLAELSALESSARAADAAGGAAVVAAHERVAEADAAVSFAREQERRLGAEARLGGVAEVDLLRARAEARRLAAQQAAAAAEVQRLVRDTQARSAQGRAQRDALQGRLAALAADAEALAARVQRLAAAREQWQLRAPVDGVLADVAAVQPGAWVAAGQALASVLPAGRLRVVAEFSPGTALGRVQAGQAAVVRLEGLPWMQHGSLIAHVERVAAEVRDQGVRVELALDASHTPTGVALQHGQTGRVEVALEAVSPAQLLLRSLGAR